MSRRLSPPERALPEQTFLPSILKTGRLLLVCGVGKRKMTDEGKSFTERFEDEYPDTDLYCYFGAIRRPFDDGVIQSLRVRKNKEKYNDFHDHFRW